MHTCQQEINSLHYNRNFISFLPDTIENVNRKIRIMQWNILAQGFVPLDEFIYCPLKHLSLRHRCDKIVNEIFRFHPDFICLQEADIIKFIVDELNAKSNNNCLFSYEFLPKLDSPCLMIKNNHGADGLAIIYRIDRFQLIKSCSISLDDKNKRQALFCHFKHIDPTSLSKHSSSKANSFIHLICVHLKAKMEFSQLRLDQGSKLLDYLDGYFQTLPNSTDLSPIFICGDFNANPLESVIKLMEDFKFQNHPHLKLSSSYCTSRPNEIQCQRVDNPNDGGEGDPDHLSDSDVTNSNRMIVECEPKFTTWKFRQSPRINGLSEVCHTIDYIWHVKQLASLIGVWSLPSKCQIGPHGLPSALFPSDHMNLVADFLLCK